MRRFFILIILSLIGLDSMAAPPVRIRPHIAHIAKKLNNASLVHFGYAVGYAGRLESNNKYYKLYLKLTRIARTKELVALAEQHGQKIVVYAFSILHKRQFPELKDIFLQHRNDSTWYWTAGGCTGVLNRINWFMLQRMRPIEKEGTKNFLSKEEYEELQKEIRGSDLQY